MNNLNIGLLVSSILATTGLGIYVYMNNNNNNNNNIITEYLHDEEVNDADPSNDNESDKNMKSTKKMLTVKSKRRANKQTGTRRKRY